MSSILTWYPAKWTGIIALIDESCFKCFSISFIFIWKLFFAQSINIGSIPRNSPQLTDATKVTDAVSNKDSEDSYGKDFEEQEIPIDDDLSKLLSQNIDVRSENGYASGGEGGYASDGASSINTDEILKDHPMPRKLRL